MEAKLLLEWLPEDNDLNCPDISFINWSIGGQCLKIEKLGSDNLKNTICCYALKCSNKDCPRIHFRDIEDYRNLQTFLTDKLSGTSGNPNQWIPTKVFKDLKNLEKRIDKGRKSSKILIKNSDDCGFDRNIFKKNIPKRTLSTHSDISTSSGTTILSDLSYTNNFDIIQTVIQLGENNSQIKKLCIKHLQNLGEEMMLSIDLDDKSITKTGLQLYKTMEKWSSI